MERLEILKGPASVLYGQMEPGGTIDVVTKQPLDYYQAEVGAEYGSYDYHRTTLDVTGPLNDRVRARLNLAHQDSNASMDYWGYERLFVAPRRKAPSSPTPTATTATTSTSPGKTPPPSGIPST